MLSPYPSLRMGGRDPHKSRRSYMTLPTIAAERHLLSVVLGKPAATDLDNEKICARNRAKLNMMDLTIYGAPVKHNDFWEFRTPGERLQTPLMDRTTIAGIIVAATPDTDTGSTSADRAPLIGNWITTQSRGFSLSIYSPSIYRLFCYTGAGPTLESLDLPVPVNTVNRPRPIYFELTSTTMTLINLAGDSGGVDGADNIKTKVLAGPRRLGELPISLGNFSDNDYYNRTCLHRAELFDGPILGEQRVAAVGPQGILGFMGAYTDLDPANAIVVP